MSQIHVGQRWEFVNGTTGDVTEYELAEWESREKDMASPLAWLTNVETGGQAQVFLSSLFEMPGQGLSHWRLAA